MEASGFQGDMQWHNACTSRVGSQWVLVSVQCMPAGSEIMDLSSPEWLVRAGALPGGAQGVELSLIHI